ncbi:cytochrome p450 714a2 [Quercus suber]|uniref:Cytochrome p450 714a2 n=1 Tax=Quercus suber TaxID=58331 RepID=A0AAW0MEK0_QUESU
MGLLELATGFNIAVSLGLFLVTLRVLFSCWISPTLKYWKIRRNGFGGPTPSFPFGNIKDIVKMSGDSSLQSSNSPHDIHSNVFPYFSQWQKRHGKTFIYWLGTEPFLYIAEPEFLKKMSGSVMAKNWGKPTVFKNDRDPMFGNGLVMVEGDEWVRQRHVITPAFNPINLKMGWVLNEVLRLYPSAPNLQRQAREDIRVDDLTIPNGTNMWIDLVAMHHDPEQWGEDVNEFKPKRFKGDMYGGCKHKMGYLPFGFGGRMCIGRNLTFMEYKIVLTLILSRFSFTLSPTYTHSPTILLSLRPKYGLPLRFQPL